jgi:hypothetical protein
MNKFKFEAYKKEFPFLQGILGECTALGVDSIAVKRADENLLARIPEETRWDGSLGESYSWDKVHFVLNDGTIKENAVATGGESGSNYAHSETRRWEGETVLEALSRLDNPDDVKYIVWESRDYSAWSGQETIDRYDVTIYKPPKGVKFSDLIRQAAEKALAGVRAEADF